MKQAVIPGISPRELKRALKRMGIDVSELNDVEKVVIVTKDKEITINQAQVMVFSLSGQKIFQITGKDIEEKKRVEEREEIEISEEDIKFVAEQAGVSFEEAREALVKAKGDLAEAILLLKQGSGE